MLSEDTVGDPFCESEDDMIAFSLTVGLVNTLANRIFTQHDMVAKLCIAA